MKTLVAIDSRWTPTHFKPKHYCYISMFLVVCVHVSTYMCLYACTCPLYVCVSVSIREHI
jgi:hypothetical protein